MKFVFVIPVFLVVLGNITIVSDRGTAFKDIQPRITPTD